MLRNYSGIQIFIGILGYVGFTILHPDTDYLKGNPFKRMSAIAKRYALIHYGVIVAFLVYYFNTSHPLFGSGTVDLMLIGIALYVPFIPAIVAGELNMYCKEGKENA